MELLSIELESKKETNVILEDYQLVVNSDFSDGTTGWSITGAIGSVANGIYSFTASTQDGRIYQYMNLLTGKYYINVRIKADSNQVVCAFSQWCQFNKS